jgi:hypothetical protein
MALKEPRPKRSRARRDAEHTLACEPVPRGWSRTMRRWLAAQAAQDQVAEHWTAVVLDQPGGSVRIPLEAIEGVTVANQVLTTASPGHLGARSWWCASLRLGSCATPATSSAG